MNFQAIIEEGLKEIHELGKNPEELDFDYILLKTFERFYDSERTKSDSLLSDELLTLTKQLCGFTYLIKYINQRPFGTMFVVDKFFGFPEFSKVENVKFALEVIFLYFSNLLEKTLDKIIKEHYNKIGYEKLFSIIENILEGCFYKSLVYFEERGYFQVFATVYHNEFLGYFSKRESIIFCCNLLEKEKQNECK